MTKSKYELIIEGLDGRPLDELLDGWTFRIFEIAPYIYRVDGQSKNGYTLSGFGGRAEEALDDCIRKAKRVDFVKNTLRKIRENVIRLFKSKK